MGTLHLFHASWAPALPSACPHGTPAVQVRELQSALVPHWRPTPNLPSSLLSRVHFPHPPLPAQALATDPNFIRLSKGAYSLHCFHADKEQLVRVQPPKEKKEKDKAAGDEGATPAAAGEGEAGRQPEKDAVPMIAVEAKSWEVGWCRKWHCSGRAGLGRVF